MKTIETVVYEYDELNDKAKAKARDWYSQVSAVLDNWWDCTHEDAEQAGLKLTSFDLDSASFVRNLEGHFVVSAIECSEAILANHGEHCATYVTAKAYCEAIDALPELPPEDSPDYAETERRLCESVDALESDFLVQLLDDYTALLQQQLEYVESEEYLAEGIRANEYTFTIDGKRFG